MSGETSTTGQAATNGSANGAIVEAIKVRKTYLRGKEELAVLQDLDLTVREGAFDALMGPSGSGKSTLLNLIAGLDRPSSGQILVAGVDVGALPERSRAKWRAANIGFIFQTYNMMPVLTALENVELPLLLANLSSKERRERAKTALEVVGLSERMQHYPRELSGGQEQRVAIARAIVTDPRLIVADEPTGDLDRKSADDVLKLLERLNTEFNKTIIMVTHDPAAAERAKKVHHLDKGALL
ncbi:MAG TPA: ABC transporter ATP-binding protein [Polyangiaceae bacterium]|nr:ABC transporter ATP-binding protein [Polyangiaceae bacterium]